MHAGMVLQAFLTACLSFSIQFVYFILCHMHDPTTLFLPNINVLDVIEQLHSKSREES